VIQQLTSKEINQVSGGVIDGEMIFLGVSGVVGGLIGANFTPMIASNAATQILMVMPLSIAGGAVAGILAGGIVLASIY
tara:strand:+ start:98361 stop:98597 length:237 start_codon:yes stop_codon:yes gene_type:complete